MLLKDGKHIDIEISSSYIEAILKQVHTMVIKPLILYFASLYPVSGMSVNSFVCLSPPTL